MKTILYVDDDSAALTATQRKLHKFKDWHLILAQGAKEAIYRLTTERVDAVVTDVAMPGMSGLDLLRHIHEGLYGFIPVVVVTGIMDKAAKSKALEYGAQDLLSKPVDIEDLVARLRSVLALKSYHDELSCRNAMLEDLVATRTEELAASRLALVVQLSKAAELRDFETGNHVLRVGAFSRHLAAKLGMSSQASDEMFLAATLHDIGKIAVPDAVLRKLGALQPEERRIIESHCVIGHEILTNRESSMVKFLPNGLKWGEQPQIMKLAADIARSHHEWWDGSGYPEHLAGDQIPLPARIVAVADVLDALRSERPYKPSFEWRVAAQVIAEGRGTQFDPHVHDAFLSAEAELKEFDEMARRDDQFLVAEAA
jgi:response regulator RpfG family c-di-GMP phosphodiesterase